MFSSFTAIGLFSLTRCTSTEGNIVFQAMGSQITTTLNGSSYIYYNTEITCMDGQSMTAKIRVSTDLPVAEQPNNAIAFVTGTAYIDAVSQQGYINASCFKFVDKKPTLSSLPPGPTFFSTFFDCLGTVCGDSYVLDDEDASVAFPVLMRVCILDDIKTTRLMCIYSGQNPRWATIPVPSPGTKVHFNGMGSFIFPSGLLAVELDDIEIYFATDRRSSATSTESLPMFIGNSTQSLEI